MVKERSFASGQWVSAKDHDGNHHNRERSHLMQDLGYSSTFITPQVTSRLEISPENLASLVPGN